MSRSAAPAINHLNQVSAVSHWRLAINDALLAACGSATTLLVAMFMRSSHKH
jgi:hypothetical protein